MYYLVHYELADNYYEAREPVRALHFKHIEPYLESGEFIMGGAVETAMEAVILFKTTSKERVEEFIQKDPYVRSGVVLGWRIRKWNVAVENQIQAPKRQHPTE